MANITKIYELKVQGQGTVLTEMKKVNKEFEDARKKWKDLKDLISKGGLNSADMAKYKEEMNQAKLETERLRQETIRLKNETLALGNANKQQAADQRKAREEARLSTDEWKKLLKQLNDARNNAKNIAVKFGIDSSQFKTAQAEANAFDAKVKQIESRLGQFQRNVGNYPGNQMLQGLNKNTLESLVKSGFGNVIANQVKAANDRVKELDQELSVLKNKLDAVRTNGTGDLDAIQREIIENRQEASRFHTELVRIQNDLRNTSGVGAQSLNNLRNYFKNLRSEITGFVVGYLSFQTAMSKGQELIQNTYELADGVTAMEVELEKAAGGAQNLVDKLAQLDTRTKLPELVNIGNIAIKAGVSEGDLVGVVAAVDKIKIAFGKDFGDVETGTESLVKLINVFENGEVTEEKMLRTGNAVRTIANESVASVPFLTDFAKRMAGLKGISDITLPSVLGLASGFEQYGQSAETSSTALVRIIPKIAAETEKFSKYAKMSQKDFSALINSNPAEALIKVAEGITKNKSGIEELIKSLGDSELAKKGGAGIVSALGVLGKNADTFRKTIDSANKSYKDTSNITEAFAKKNENLSASMDKLKKNFVDAANNQNFQAFLKGVISLLTTLGKIVSSIPGWGWITVITLLTLAYYENIKALALNIYTTTVYIARQIIGNALITASTLLMRAQAIAVYIANAAWTVLNSTMLFLGTIFPALRTAWISLNLTMLATPIGWLIAGIAAVGALMAMMSATTLDAANSIKKNGQAIKQTAAEMRIAQELTKKITEATGETISKTEMLTRVLKDNSVSYETKKKVLQELINMSPKHLQALTLENIKTAEGTKILEAYKNQLIEVAKAKGVQSLIEEKTKKITENEIKLAELNYQNSLRYNKNVGGLKQMGNAIVDLASGYASKIGIGEGDTGLQIINLTAENKKLKEDSDALVKLAVKNITDGKTNSITGGTGNGSGASSNTLQALSDELKALNEEFESTEINSKRYFQLKAEIAKKQAYYDSLTKTDKKSDKGSRLSGIQKDYLKDLEADKNNELAITEKKFFKGEILETEFIKKSLASNVKYFDSKIAYLKKGNAEERKQVAQAELDKIKAIREANDKLFTLDKKRIDDTLKNEQDAADRKRDLVNNNPYSNDLDKLNAEKAYYEESTTSQINYNQGMLDLQSQYSKQSVEEVNALMRQLKEKLDSENKNNREYRIKLTKIVVTKIDDVSDSFTNANEMLASSERKSIIENKELTAIEKKIELQKIAAVLQLRNTNTELGGVIAKIRFLEEEMQIRELTNDEMKEFNKLLRERQGLEEKKAEGENNVKQTGAAIPSGLPGSGVSGLASSLTNGLKDGDGQIMIGGKDFSEQIGYGIAESFDIAQQAMNSYFDAERNRIEQSKQLAYERIDLETKQLQRFAQSAAERESINKQATEKKKKADKEAGEKLKKVKKTEAKIAFLMQLANIWSTAMQLGPIAGPIVGGVLSLLAGVQYATTVKGIDSAQYKRGGLFGKGGKLTGPSHSEGGMPVIDPVTGNKVAEMEGKEGIINANAMGDSSVYNVSGTPSQIASKINSIGGGVDWDGGATMKKFMNGGTYLGSNLQAPNVSKFSESSRSSSFFLDSSERFDRIEKGMEDLIEIQKTESMKKVFISGKEISEDQKERVKRTEIGSLS